MRLSMAQSILALPSADWDRLTRGASPFVAHPFLAALEDSGSVGRGTGWIPRYFLAWDEDRLVGALPAWLKSHSYGEYIFDWAWADGAARAGIRYYPKAVVAVPFTPATGGRILLCSDAPPETAEFLIRGLLDDAAAQGLSSVHWLFTKPEEQELLERQGHILRETVQFHWRNRNWTDWDDYLGSMRGKRRREIRRERRRLAESGCSVEMMAGPDLGDAEWNAIDRFYRDTAARKGAHPYLSPSFFSVIRERCAESVRFAAARHGGNLVGGALFFEQGDALYGRYWGCDARHRHLHFETCFYAPIEYCIARGIQLYEAGAQGEHKLPRGFAPVAVYSAHWIADERLRGAVEDFCAAERLHTARVVEMLDPHGAF
jgi:predicted N-acyltransferase